jgi:hypothetical protein
VTAQQQVGREIGAKGTIGRPPWTENWPRVAEDEGDFAVAGYLGSVKKEKAIDQVGRKGGAVQTRAGLKENLKNFAAAEFLESGFKVEPCVPTRDAKKLDASVLKLAGLGRVDGG